MTTLNDTVPAGVASVRRLDARLVKQIRDDADSEERRVVVYLRGSAPSGASAEPS